MRPSALAAMLLVLGLAGPAGAQEPQRPQSSEPSAIAPTETFELNHEQRTYRIDIYRLPAGDGPTGAPRAYVLDGERLAAPLAGNLRNEFPRWRSAGIIIGVTRTDAAPEGAARYRAEEGESLRRLLLEALRPAIDSRFGERSVRHSLVGEGDAALFVLHMAADQPEAFDAYVAHGPQLNRSLPEQIAPGRGTVHMSSVRWMGRPLDQFESLAVRFEGAGREIQVDTAPEGWDTSDAVDALWAWIGPYFIPPPV